MYECLKKVWILLIALTLCGLLASLPVGKWQRVYLNQYYKIKYEPLRRIEATYHYIEDIEDGIIPEPDNAIFEKYVKKVKIEKVPKPSEKPFQKPLFVRDKNNPNILYIYQEE
jgi:hypothetical protein